MNPKELRDKTDEELNQILLEKRDDLMHFRLQMATGVVDNVRSARAAKRDIARIKTIQAERARTAAVGARS